MGTISAYSPDSRLCVKWSETALHFCLCYIACNYWDTKYFRSPCSDRPPAGRPGFDSRQCRPTVGPNLLQQLFVKGGLGVGIADVTCSLHPLFYFNGWLQSLRYNNKISLSLSLSLGYQACLGKQMGTLSLRTNSFNDPSNIHYFTIY
jgi:hypothetical protein